jgi:hypothetical protein
MNFKEATFSLSNDQTLFNLIYAYEGLDPSTLWTN